MAKKTTAPAPAKTSRKKASAKSTAAEVAAATTHAISHPLIVSISGVRGIAGGSLDALAVARYTDAFARMVKGPRVVVGTDARPSHRWIVPIVEGILRSRGIDVAYVGLAPTPTVGVLVRKLKAAGGIAITASHNPVEYNGLKFFHSGGEFLTQEMLAELKGHVAAAAPSEVPVRYGKRAFLPEATEYHLAGLMKALPPNDRVPTAKRLTVILDCCGSAGVKLAPDVADSYGALFQIINGDTSKSDFPRGAEPLEKNIGALRRTVTKENADIGFAMDPDADRLALVDEKGQALGEERTLLLAADAFYTLTRRKSPLVTNLSSSRVLDDLASHHGLPIHRTAIGEANVLAGMRKWKARIGGEGNGGVIVPAVHPGRDAATGIALILLGLQARSGTLSDWNNCFPHYAMKKDTLALGELSVAMALSRIKKAFAKQRLDETDGVKVIFEDRWLHVRPSNTEPIVRLFSEAPDDAGADELLSRVTALFA